MMMTMGSLFDGIGGFPLAAVHNGIMPVWASEIEAFPIEVTKIRFPDMLPVGDITKLNGATLLILFAADHHARIYLLPVSAVAWQVNAPDYSWSRHVLQRR